MSPASRLRRPAHLRRRGAPPRCALVGALLALAAAPALGQEAASEPAAPSEPDGDTIYRRVLDNRFDSYEEELQMVSGDGAGNEQRVQLTLKYLSLRDQSDRILSKSIAKYEAPQDVRHLGYLVINKLEGADDQFVYRPSSRRVRRINLRGEAVAGTDFAFEDVIPQEFEDAAYRRLADVEHQGRDCHVVEVVPVEDADSEYSRLEVTVDRESYVPLRTRYWDDNGVPIKELEARPESIRRFEEKRREGPKEVYVALESRMVHLQLGSYTDLTRSGTRPDRRLRERDFSQRELTSGR